MGFKSKDKSRFPSQSDFNMLFFILVFSLIQCSIPEETDDSTEDASKRSMLGILGHYDGLKGLIFSMILRS